MKGIINFTDLALMYYGHREVNPYEDLEGTRKIVARANFRKTVNYDQEALKAAKEEYLKAVKDALKDIK